MSQKLEAGSRKLLVVVSKWLPASSIRLPAKKSVQLPAKNRLSANNLRFSFPLILTCFCQPLFAQSPFKPFENLFTPPLSYVVHQNTKPIVIDGDLNDAAWQQAAWTSSFVDIEGSLKPLPKYETKVKMLWDNSCLYIAARITEPHVWAALKKRDQVIFNDNDFEVFINPDATTHHYYEAEFNALNTIFDLYMAKPYRNGGSALVPFNLSGMRSAVKIAGTLNNAGDTDTGWTVEIAIPFGDISLGNDVKVPVEGSIYRINFSRVEWDTKLVNGQYIRATDSAGHRLPEHNWVWSAQGVVNMHYPERWGYLQFTKQTGPVAFVLPYGDKQQKYLWLLYYKQKQWFTKHQSYAKSVKLLGFKSRKVKIDGTSNWLSADASRQQFTAFIETANGGGYDIDQDGFVQMIKPAAVQ